MNQLLTRNIADTDTDAALEFIQVIQKAHEGRSGALYHDLHGHMVQVMMEKLDLYGDKGKDVVDRLKERQSCLRFLHELMREINKCTDKKGTVKKADMTERLKELIDQAERWFEEGSKLKVAGENGLATANSLEKSAAEWEKIGKEKNDPIALNNAKTLRERADKVRQEATQQLEQSHLLYDTGHIAGKLKKDGVYLELSEKDKALVMKNMDFTIDDFNTVNQMDFQEAQQINQHRHSIQMMAKMVIKQLHDMIMGGLRATKG